MRSKMGFFVLFFVNPVIIIFFQNCSFVPHTTAGNVVPQKPVPQMVLERTPANTSEPR